MLFKYIVPFDIEKNKKHPTLETKTIRATTSIRANFLSILQEKTYFFYSIHPFLQNTLINLSILHIYSIKYSFFLHLLLFPSLSSLEQTHKLVFSVEPYPHPTNHPSAKSVEAHPHPSFNKITHTQPATIFSVKLQTQHKPKITHTQPPSTTSNKNDTNSLKDTDQTT